MKFRSNHAWGGSTTLDTPDEVWRYETVTSDDHLARIADALERIAAALENPPGGVLAEGNVR